MLLMLQAPPVPHPLGLFLTHRLCPGSFFSASLFPVPISPEGEGLLCYILPFVLYFLLFTLFSVISLYCWRNTISVASCLIARSWFFVFSQYKGIPAIPLYGILHSTNLRMIPPTLVLWAYLIWGAKDRKIIQKQGMVVIVTNQLAGQGEAAFCIKNFLLTSGNYKDFANCPLLRPG